MPASNINRTIITGNLTADPELRETPSGTKVARLRVAVSEAVKNRDTGEWGDRADYFDVIVWGGQGENAHRYLSKGRGVAVYGRLRWREYDASDGSHRQAVEIVADTVQFLGSHTNDPAPSVDEPAAADADADADADEDIPF